MSKKTDKKDEIVTGAAKATGSADAKIAVPAGGAEPAPLRQKSSKPAKLKKKNNVHLPRLVKKAQKKAAAALALAKA